MNLWRVNFYCLALPVLPVLPAAKHRYFAGAGGKRIYRQNGMYSGYLLFSSLILHCNCDSKSWFYHSDLQIEYLYYIYMAGIESGENLTFLWKWENSSRWSPQIYEVCKHLEKKVVPWRSQYECRLYLLFVFSEERNKYLSRNK